MSILVCFIIDKKGGSQGEDQNDDCSFSEVATHCCLVQTLVEVKSPALDLFFCNLAKLAFAVQRKYIGLLELLPNHSARILRQNSKNQ